MPCAGFSLHSGGQYIVPRVTHARGVTPNIPYWVRADFNPVGGRREGVQMLEKDVEKAFYTFSKQRCAGDRQRLAELQNRVLTSRGTIRTYLERLVRSCVSTCVGVLPCLMRGACIPSFVCAEG